MNDKLLEYILWNRQDLGVAAIRDGIAYSAEDTVIELDIPTLQAEADIFYAGVAIQQTVATIEGIYSRQVLGLFKRASALPSQPVRRLTAGGQATQNLVYQTNQTAEALGLVVVMSDVQKQAMVAILPWLELASKICDKLTEDTLAGIDTAASIKLANDLALTKEDLTAEKLASLQADFGIA